jgi:hypothetical protein
MSEQVEATRTRGHEVDIQALQVRERIALATAAAMFVAGVLLMTVILPAEYGVDPVGTGGWLGLTQIAQSGQAPAAVATSGGSALEPLRPGANTPQSVPFRRHTMTLPLAPKEGVELKYRLEKGAGMVYTWKAPVAVVHEFHGEPDGAAKGYADFYEEKGQQAATGSGTFYAPTTGIHGWWWENLSDQPIEVTIDAAGFMIAATEFRSTGKKDVPLPAP